MTDVDIIIIGAGAAGLMAARELIKAGNKVLILEARNRLGGRIYTQTISEFSIPTEAGAEFVHGDLELTQTLLAEINSELLLMEGQSYQIKNGELQLSSEFIADFDKLLEKMNQLKEDMPLAGFLEQYLAEEEFADLRNSVTRFAEGYDAADTRKVSTFALRDEWQSGGAESSFHPQGGYSHLIDYLAAQCRDLDGEIHLATVVKEIKWSKGHVEVICISGKGYQAGKVLITVPLGVLQANPEDEGYISFTPELPDKRAAFKTMGFGAVIKILLEFKEAFWENENFAPESRQLPELAFLFADGTPFTAWWTQLPDKTPLLTGWLAGPQAKEHEHMPENKLLLTALESLAYILDTTVDFLQTRLNAYQVINWAADPYARGAYAYATLSTPDAIKVVSQPVQNTLFFAGEAFYEGHAMGTVEAALASGKEVVHKILASNQEK